MNRSIEMNDIQYNSMGEAYKGISFLRFLFRLVAFIILHFFFFFPFSPKSFYFPILFHARRRRRPDSERGVCLEKLGERLIPFCNIKPFTNPHANPTHLSTNSSRKPNLSGLSPSPTHFSFQLLSLQPNSKVDTPLIDH